MIRLVKRSLFDFIKSPISLLTIGVYTLFLYLRTSVEFSLGGDSGLVYYFHFMPKLEGIGGVLILILCYPATRYFNSIWNSGMALFELMRLGKRKFIISILLIVVLSSAYITLLSQILYSIFMLSKTSVLGTSRTNIANLVAAFGGFRTLLTGSNFDVLLYFITIFLHKIYEVIFYVILTLFCSVKIRDNYIISVLPFVFFNLSNILLDFFSSVFPPVFSLIMPQSVIDHEFIFERVLLRIYPQYYFDGVAMVYPFVYTLILLVLSYFVMRLLLEKEYTQIDKIEVVR